MQAYIKPLGLNLILDKEAHLYGNLNTTPRILHYRIAQSLYVYNLQSTALYVLEFYVYIISGLPELGCRTVST